MSLSRRSRKIASKATGERRRRLRKALPIAASLAIAVAAAPALAQEIAAPAGTLEGPRATPYRSDTPTVTGEAPSTGYQEGEIGGIITPLEVIPSGPAPGQRAADPGQPPGANLEDPDARADQDPGDPPGNQDLAQLAAQEAQEAAEEAQLAASDAQEVVSTLQRSSAPSEDVQVAQEVAQEAQLAASDAQEAAEVAQEAATQEDVSSAQEAAQVAQGAAQEAQETSGAVQQVARQVAQQAVENFGGSPGDLKDAYTRALRAARSADAEGDNVALAAESGPEKGAQADPEKTSSSSEEYSGKAANGKEARKGTTEKTQPEEDADEEPGSNAAVTPPTGQGGFPLLLGGGVALAAGAFAVARKLIWS
jgi:hypothetical protein